MKGLFVTSCGTGIGKTHLSCVLIAQMRAAGRRVRPLKPVISGYEADDPDSDTARLIAAAGLPDTSGSVEAVSPWRFAAPLSPHLAARREGRSLSVDAVADFCRRALAGAEDAAVVEGVGGVMAPMSDSETVVDWIAALGLPALLVTGSYLGSLSHALSAAAVLDARGVPLAGVVVSESAESTVALPDTVDTLTRFLAPVPVHALVRGGEPGPLPYTAWGL